MPGALDEAIPGRQEQQVRIECSLPCGLAY